jgi:hypothetical protein
MNVTFDQDTHSVRYRTEQGTEQDPARHIDDAIRFARGLADAEQTGVDLYVRRDDGSSYLIGSYIGHTPADDEDDELNERWRLVDTLFGR